MGRGIKYMQLFKTKNKSFDIFLINQFDRDNNYYMFNVLPNICIQVDTTDMLPWTEITFEWLFFNISVMITNNDDEEN